MPARLPLDCLSSLGEEVTVFADQRVQRVPGDAYVAVRVDEAPALAKHPHHRSELLIPMIGWRMRRHPPAHLSVVRGQQILVLVHRAQASRTSAR